MPPFVPMPGLFHFFVNMSGATSHALATRPPHPWVNVLRIARALTRAAAAATVATPKRRGARGRLRQLVREGQGIAFAPGKTFRRLLTTALHQGKQLAAGTVIRRNWLCRHRSLRGHRIDATLL